MQPGRLFVLGNSIELIDGKWIFRPHNAPASPFAAHTTVPKSSIFITDLGLYLTRQRRKTIYIGLTPRMTCRLFVDGLLTVGNIIKTGTDEVWVTLHFRLQGKLEPCGDIECVVSIRSSYGEDYLFFTENGLRLI